MDRLEAKVKAKGLTVFARVDRASEAAAVGMLLRPTEVLIFGKCYRWHATHGGQSIGRGSISR